MKIERLRVKNFRAFKDVEMREIPRFAILVGANGTGKSTLFTVFGFLRDAMNTNVRVALSQAWREPGLPGGEEQELRRTYRDRNQVQDRVRRPSDNLLGID